MPYEDESFFDDYDVDNVEESPSFSVFKYTCNTCNSVYYSSTNQDVKQCIICSNEGVSCNSFEEKKETFRVCFNKTKNDFIRLYKKKLFWNPLVPIKFKKKKVIQSVKEIYLSSVLSNINQKGTLYFIGGEREKNSSNRLETKRYTVAESVHFDYNNVLLNTNSKLDDKIFQTVCDYDFSNLEKVHFDDNSDSFYLIGDILVASIAERTREKIAKQTVSIARQNVAHPLKKLRDDQSLISFANSKEVFVPVYLLNVEYKNDIYQCMMNGQNGKFYFKVPIGIKETIFFIFFVFGIVFLIAYLIAYFL